MDNSQSFHLAYKGKVQNTIKNYAQPDGRGNERNAN